MSWWEERAGLAGTVAIVTGGAGGLGGAITRDLAANGVSVGIVDRDAAAIEALTKDLPEVLAHEGDARDPEVLDRLFDAVDTRWGRLDTLVNVVGGTFRAPFEGQAAKAWDTLIRTNLTHVLHATSLAVPRMKAGGRGGSIVSLTTIEAHRAAPNFAVYAAAKAAVTHFSRTMAVELAPSGIRVNCVAPDITPTENMLKISSGAGFDPRNVAAAIPMGRVGRVEDISGVVVFLASGLSSYITGTTLHPDGGTWASAGWFNWPGDGWGNMVPNRVLDALE